MKKDFRYFRFARATAGFHGVRASRKYTVSNIDIRSGIVTDILQTIQTHAAFFVRRMSPASQIWMIICGAPKQITNYEDNV